MNGDPPPHPPPADVPPPAAPELSLDLPSQREPLPLPPAPPERYPFWGYSDLILFIGIAIPCMLLGGVIGLLTAKAFVAILHLHSKIPAMAPLAGQLGGDVLVFCGLALLLRLQYDRPFWSSLAWTPTRIPVIWVMLGGLSCAIAVAMLGVLIGTPTTSNPITELMHDRASAVLMAIFGVTIAPLTEELVFRGFLQPLLVRSLGALPGIVLAAIPFGLLHYSEYGNSWRHAVLIALAGTAFGWVRHYTGSTQASAIMHASYNALIFFAVFSK